ncbi:unnamed protein product, partial [Staurois parvus]
CTVSAVSGHLLYCVRSLWSSPVLLCTCVRSLWSSLYRVRSLWSSLYVSAVSGHPCTVSAVSGHPCTKPVSLRQPYAVRSLFFHPQKLYWSLQCWHLVFPVLLCLQ